VAIVAGQAGLRIAKLEWPNGKSWLAGEDFRVRIHVQNESSGPVLLWRGTDICNLCGELVFRRPGADPVRLRNGGIAFSGVAVPLRLQPGEVAVYEVDLGGTQRPLPGTYQVTAEFSNSESSAGGWKGVWTGRITAPPEEVVVR
jgi:hypothetical protein